MNEDFLLRIGGLILEALLFGAGWNYIDKSRKGEGVKLGAMWYLMWFPGKEVSPKKATKQERDNMLTIGIILIFVGLLLLPGALGLELYKYI